VLEGDLGDFTLTDILKLLSFTNKTGRLGIVTDDARGRVDLVGGRLRDASAAADHLPLARRLLGRRLLDGSVVQALLGAAETLPTDLELARQLIARDQGSAEAVGEVLQEQTLDAVFDLLRWTTGTFRFESGTDPEAADTPPVLELSVDHALNEAARRLEAWPEVHERTGPGNAVVHVGRPSETSVAVDANGWQLLGLADGKRTVDELSVLCGRGQFDTRSTLAALLELGVVTIATDGSGDVEDGLLADQALLSRLEASLSGLSVPQTGDGVDQDQHAIPAAVAPEPYAPQAEIRDVAVASEPVRIGAEVLGSGAKRVSGRVGLLGQDPTVDADLVNRLITGVEEL
jgi:hypothetical protein